MRRSWAGAKVLIANRGEIAVRVIRTCREHGLKSVAVYSEADLHAPHVDLADESYLLGPAPAGESYLNIRRILEAARRSRATAVHPGYGFLSENPVFARAVRRAGLIFIGPTERSMRVLGDKVAARHLAASLGIPVVPGSHEPITRARDAASVARKVGYPVLIKAAGGGGGKGMRIVQSEGGLEGALTAARTEARLAFGDDRVFLEKYIQRPRHVEVQVLAEVGGKAVHLGERECSIQRRHQKVIEESPSTFVDANTRAQLTQAALKIVKRAGYSNAGTVEFILDEDRHFYFLEVNTRLQVEHPVTEMRVGLDIVWEQITLAHGQPLSVSQDGIHFRGHAIECRIYAEDPENEYFPSSGSIVSLSPPGGPGIREDRGVEEGGEISAYYDTMVSKIIAWGGSRTEAISRSIRALEDYEIFGVKTNIAQCLSILRHPKFRSGRYDTNFLEEQLPKLSPIPKHALLSAAAVCILLEQAQAGEQPGNNHEVKKSEWRTQSLDWMSDEAS